MALGAKVRSMFGPYERAVSDLYRAAFIDLDEWSRTLLQWAPDALRILEVGCGEGAMTERLARNYLQARIVAIDVTPRLGRMFEGDRSRVDFIQTAVEDVAKAHPHEFDLILLSDVIHHVPLDLRASILAAIGDALAPGGQFVFKDWVRNATPIHWLCEASDRYLTGDDVSYLDEAELRQLTERHFGCGAICDERRVGPWRNNMALRVTPAPTGDMASAA